MYILSRRCKSVFVFVFLISYQVSFAQVNELEALRTATYNFVEYDNAKKNKASKNKTDSLLLRTALNKAFMEFVLHKDSKDLTALKRDAINNRTSYIINNHNYFFHELRRDYAVKSTENNVNHQIVFYGMYDYQLSNFISIYIQPFTVSNKNLVIYYYKLNGKGTYFIKDLLNNKVIFESEAYTSNAPIVGLHVIDHEHYLLVEDMENNGQRAMVLNGAAEQWKKIKAFKGIAFQHPTQEYTQKISAGLRSELRFAENKNIVSIYGPSFLKKYEIKFDEKSNTISYKEYRINDAGFREVKAEWKNKCFEIDDYYIGEHLNDEPMPYPG